MSIFILLLDINFIFYYSDSRKLGRSTFARSLIFNVEISVILKFYCSEFWPSPSTLNTKTRVVKFFFTQQLKFHESCSKKKNIPTSSCLRLSRDHSIRSEELNWKSIIVHCCNVVTEIQDSTLCVLAPVLCLVHVSSGQDPHVRKCSHGINRQNTI